MATVALAQLLLLGAAGCRTEVLNERQYKSSKGETVEPAPATEVAPRAALAPAEEPQPVSPKPLAFEPPVAPSGVEPAPAAKPAPAAEAAPRREFAPMEKMADTPKPTNTREKAGKPADKSGKSADKAAKPAEKSGEYIVQKGDTPEIIARRNKVSLNSLMTANSLTEESARKLRVGQKLVIPGGTAVAPAAKKEAAKEGGAVAPSVTADGVYEVKPNDNVSTIAQKLKVKRSALMEANNLTEESARKLRVGQKLRLPGSTADVSTTAKKQSPPSPPVTKDPAATGPVDLVAPPDVLPDTPVAPAANTVAGGSSSKIAIVAKDTTAEEFAAANKTPFQTFLELNKNDIPKDGILRANDYYFVLGQ